MRDRASTHNKAGQIALSEVPKRYNVAVDYVWFLDEKYPYEWVPNEQDFKGEIRGWVAGFKAAVEHLKEKE